MEKKRKKKQNKLSKNLLKVVRQFVIGRSYRPLTFPELITRLQIPPQYEEELLSIMTILEQEGVVSLTQGRYSIPKLAPDTVTGVINMHPRGFGFVQPEASSTYDQDIFIPKPFTMNAVNGDTVEVVVNTIVSEKGPEGKVVAILERARSHLAGIVTTIEVDGDIIAYVPLLGTNQRVVVQTPEDHLLRAGDRIVMEVIDWGTKETETVCRMTHYLGHISDPSVDISAAIEEYELRKSFSSKVLKEAEIFGTQVTKKEMEAREDLRSQVCFTIDPDTAKDFDDAIHLSKDDQGIYHLGVHIADVSHYVTPGSALDKEAALRCNSTYFPALCLPMLPSSLSENLCSLKPLVNRLTVSVLADLDAEGNLIDYRICRSVIKSCKRFTYKEAKEVLDGKKKSPHLKTLQLMVELCQALKRKRYERGSIEFALSELMVIVDDKGLPVRTESVSYDITHQLVEEFMLKANEIVAWHLSNQGKNLTYRIHDEPSEENIRDFAILARAFGYDIKDKPTSKELQLVFDQAMNTPYGSYLATSFIRRMRLAIYSPENIGHYGLALAHYCHFTSPIRRYVDLVIHRILFGMSDDLENLQAIALRCSEQERISAKAESNVVLLKKLRLLQQKMEADIGLKYEAIVTRVKNFGFFFEVLELALESFLHVSELEDDYFIYDETRMHLRGRHTGKIYAPGDRILVMPQNINLISLESNWYLAQSTPSKKSKPSSGKKKESRSRQPTAKNKVGKSDRRKPSETPSKELKRPRIGKNRIETETPVGVRTKPPKVLARITEKKPTLASVKRAVTKRKKK